MALGDVIAKLSVVLGMDTVAFEKGATVAEKRLSQQERRFQSFSSKVSTIGKAVGGALLASGIGDVISSYRDMGNAALDSVGGLGEQAAALGVSTDALQQFRYAATQVGLTTEQVDGALGQFSKRLGQAELTGKGPFVAALKEINLTLDDLKGKSETDQIALIAEGIQGAGSEAQKAALRVQFFGKQGQATAALLEGGSAGIKAFADEARKLGVVISAEDIAKADETADKLSKLNYVIEAQSNKKLLENADALVAYEQAVGNFKLFFISGIGDLEKANQRYNAWALNFHKDTLAALHSFADGVNGGLQRAHVFVVDFFGVGRDLVVGLANGVKANAVAVWEAVKGVVSGGITRAKNLLGIRSPSRVFQEIGDYIGQGLAIGIEGGSARVEAATRKLTEAARRAAEETRDLFARLFPEIEKANQYREDLKRIEASGRSDDARNAARLRLDREVAGIQGDAPVRVADTASLAVIDGIDKALAKFDLFKDKGKATTVAVAKSFKDMADATIQSLGNLANAIKGGGFLGILEAVVGLGLQLGSIGVFGKTAATRINAPKIGENANGTNAWRGGLTWVGERGAEIVDLPRGSRVFNNSESRQMMSGGKLQVEVVANNNGFGAIVRNQAGQVIAEAAPALMDGSARVAQASIDYRQSRRVA
jgi:hypothetical protein